jgi:tRNA A37 threonylcarbamoyladenosine dehydratase
MLLQEEAMDKLASSRIIIFGVGGVGGYCCEALARSSVGAIDIVDNDTVSITNINRQIIATTSTIGQYKVDIMKKRVLDINPDININAFKTFYTPDNSSEFDFSKYDYVIDAIDTVKSKIELIIKAKEKNVPIISAMGAGNKLNPLKFEVADIYKTSVCPLARVIRTELKKRGIKDLKVVYSKEQPIKPLKTTEDSIKRQIPGSIATLPSIMGLIIANEVIKDLIS